jgi:hypothetical protein
MPSWPAWVALRIGLLTTETQLDRKTGRKRPMAMLPANSTLTTAEREELERHAARLDALRNCTAANDAEAENDVLVAVTKMMLVLPSATQNELSAEARGEAFLAALDDVPAWAVVAAIRSWNRGECGPDANGQPYDYHWCPAPAELRRIALAKVRPLNERAITIQALLRAEPLLEYTDEHRRKMGERLAELSRDLQASLVGKTAAVKGSAGAGR